MPEHRGRPRRPRRALLALCLAAVATTAGIAVAPAGYAEPEPTITEVREQVDSLYRQAEEATERYNAATEELAEVQLRLEQAQASIERQEATLEEARGSIAAYAAASYRSGSTFDPVLQAILSDDPTTFLSQTSAVDAYASQQADQLAVVLEQSRALEQAQMEADEELARQQAIEDSLELEKTTIEQHLADAQAILDGLEAEELAALEQEREDAANQADRGDEDEDEPDYPDVPASERAQFAIDYALAQVGKPYCWGGEGEDCFDCSGLTSAAWAEAGVSLSRTSRDQIDDGSRVSMSQLAPGDLVFFYDPISHVGIYIGDGLMVHATHPGSDIAVDPISIMPFSGASRPG